MVQAGGIVAFAFAFFVVPKIMPYIPNDPLVIIIGLFSIVALLQHLGLSSQAGPGDDSGYRHRSTETKEEEEDKGTKLEHHLREADRCIQQNNYDRAKELAQMAADLDPECARAWELKATAQKWLGQREEALATVRIAKETYEVDSDGLNALIKELGQSKSPAEIASESEAKGEEFFSKRMYDLASPCYVQAIEALGCSDAAGSDRPLYLRLLRRRAECAQQLQDWGQCRRDATSLLEEDPNDARALLQRAAANEALEKFQAALDDARRLLTIDRTSAAANRIVHNCQQALRG